jgi:hypothetical protein
MLEEEGTMYDSVGIKEPPLWTFIPINKYLCPKLHLLLGLGNNMVDKFMEWIEERMEPLTPEETEARNIALMSQLAFEEAEDSYETISSDLQLMTIIRQELNKEVREARGEEKNNLKQQKVEVDAQVDKMRAEKKEKETIMKDMKTVYDKAKDVEKTVRGEKKRSEKPVIASIEKIWAKFNMKVSVYHGRDLEGNSLRTYLGKSKEILIDNIAPFLKSWRDEQQSSDIKDVSNEEVDEVCTAHARLLSLLDQLFAILGMERGKVDDAVVKKFNEVIELMRVKWLEMELPLTLKWHLLLNHSLTQLVALNGFADMSEDRIERYHQLRERLRDRTRRITDKIKVANTQAKLQQIIIDPRVIQQQQAIYDATTRKRKAAGTLKQENDSEKKIKRMEDREPAADEVKNEERVNISSGRKKMMEYFKGKAI